MARRLAGCLGLPVGGLRFGLLVGVNVLVEVERIAEGEAAE